MQVLNIFHVLIAIAMIAFILVQRGAGATAGAAFGSGASGTVFGARGAGNFMSRTTWVLATLFCAISLTMAVVVSRSGEPDTDLGVVGTMTNTEQQATDTTEDVPADDAAADLVDDLPVAEEDLESVDDVPDLPPAEEGTDSGEDADG